MISLSSISILSFFSNFLSERETLKKSAISFIWHSIDLTVKLTSLFILSIFLARVLGPTEYGYYSYIIAFISIFIPLSSFGLHAISVRELTQNNKSTFEIIGSIFLLRLIASLLSLIIAVFCMYLIRSQDQQSQLLVFVLMLGVSFQASDLIESWFQVKMNVRNLVMLKSTIICIFTVLKLISLIIHQSIFFFIFISTFELFVLSSGILLLASRKGLPFFLWKINLSYIKTLIPQAVPLILSGLAIMIYAKADFIFLQYFLGSNIVAQYAVALGITEVFAILPALLFKSIAPVLFHAGKYDPKVFKFHMVNLYRLMTVAFLGMIFIIWLVAVPLIPFVYGSAYNPAKSILIILSFRLFFTNFGIARSIIINHEKYYKFDLFTNIVGAVINVGGNILLIPILGVNGALIASLGALAFSTFFLDYFHPRLRENLLIELKGILTLHKIRLSQRD